MKPIATMNVIPFIDIMLVLLAIVLMTATFVAQGRIPVDLPQAASARSERSIDPVEITITADGSIFIDGREQAADSMAERIAGFDSGRRLVIRVDRHAAFEHFIRVIDPVNAAGLKRVSILATQAPQ